jgi:hypothetical protein
MGVYPYMPADAHLRHRLKDIFKKNRCVPQIRTNRREGKEWKVLLSNEMSLPQKTRVGHGPSTNGRGTATDVEMRGCRARPLQRNSVLYLYMPVKAH